MNSDNAVVHSVVCTLFFLFGRILSPASASAAGGGGESLRERAVRVPGELTGDKLTPMHSDTERYLQKHEANRNIFNVSDEL